MTDQLELTCKELVEIVTDYVEGSMDPRERVRFEEHLAICDGCTQYMHQMRETIRLTGMLTEEHLADEQRSTLLLAFRNWKQQA